ncbi:Crp/Fnr family transcriptional regulator [Oceanospirillum sediminis]|nr:Crp/Fnr family transcriptional regulator [Oceanospirillum sediminis]
MKNNVLEQSFRKYFAGLAPEGMEINWSFLKQEAEVRHFAKGDFLFRQGDEAPDLFFLHNGLARYVSVSDEGKEFTQSFAMGPRLAGSTRAMAGRCPVLFGIEIMEDALVLSWPWQVFFQQMSACPVFLRAYIQMLEALFIGKEERENALAKHTAEQRYLDFVTGQPELAERIPLQFIASYIGVTPVALSRIRHRLKAG